jgi:hypothetical protein
LFPATASRSATLHLTKIVMPTALPRFISTTLACLLLAAVNAIAQSATPAAVQVDLSKLLNARVVITQKDGRLQLSDHGLDFGNSILITQSAAEVAKSGKLTPLPDSDLFAANDQHPDVKLHYAQADGGPQVHRSPGKTETNTFPVPNQRYRQMQLFLISAAGATPISVELRYADGSSGQRTTRVPDFFFLPKDEDKGWFVLVNDFGKVNQQGLMTEAAHHYIHGFNLDPDSAKVLQQVEIIKENSGSVLNLFGAAGTPAQLEGDQKAATSPPAPHS